MPVSSMSAEIAMRGRLFFLNLVGIQVNPNAATREYIEFLLRFWRPPSSSSSRPWWSEWSTFVRYSERRYGKRSICFRPY